MKLFWKIVAGLLKSLGKTLLDGLRATCVALIITAITLAIIFLIGIIGYYLGMNTAESLKGKALVEQYLACGTVIFIFAWLLFGIGYAIKSTAQSVVRRTKEIIKQEQSK